MSNNEFIFLGIGNPLLDISAVVNPALLTKYGLNPNDAVLATEAQKELYTELVRDYKVDYVAGGAAQNAMRGAQWLLPKNSTVYIGAAGKDKEAKLLIEAAAKDGLLTNYMEVDQPTGRCAVLITGIKRSLVTDLMAANEYKITHLKSDAIWKNVVRAKFVYLGGYFLTVSPDSALEVAKYCAGEDKSFTMNLSAPFIAQFFKDQVDSLSMYWDVLFANEAEALAYSESHNLGTTDIKEIALKIAALPKANTKRSRMVVFTQGALPTIIAQDGNIKEFPVIAIDVKNIVDTNGAGDAYCGGFMSQFVQNKSVEVCAAAGNYVANVVIQRNGPTYPETAHAFVAPQ